MDRVPSKTKTDRERSVVRPKHTFSIFNDQMSTVLTSDKIVILMHMLLLLCFMVKIAHVNAIYARYAYQNTGLHAYCVSCVPAFCTALKNH